MTETCMYVQCYCMGSVRVSATVESTARKFVICFKQCDFDLSDFPHSRRPSDFDENH